MPIRILVVSDLQNPDKAREAYLAAQSLEEHGFSCDVMASCNAWHNVAPRPDMDWFKHWSEKLGSYNGMLVIPGTGSTLINGLRKFVGIEHKHVKVFRKAEHVRRWAPEAAFSLDERAKWSAKCPLCKRQGKKKVRK